ncbi:MAG TPA: type VII secretion integral membrane protein EccD [Mycobacterium sp.]|nr:type VII secretion integral membrane protein EccD [Mycobacterium sp.]
MSSKLASDICRVAVQTEAGRLDLVLPANIVVAALIPPLVDLISPTAQGRAAADWQLSRIGDGPISARHSLADNDVHDGDLLLLQAGSGAVAPKPQGDVIVGIPGSLDRFPRWDTTARRAAGLIISVCSSGFTAFALLQGDRHVGALLAAAVAVAAFSGAVACGRVYRERLSAVALGVCAVVTAAVAGYLVVPGQELAPKAMLAAAAAATISVVAARGIGSGTTVFTAIASLGLLTALCAGISAFLPVGVDGAGALLAAIALGALGLAARVALRISRPGADGDADRTSEIVTGLTGGSTAAAVLGAGLVLVGGGFLGAGLTAVVGAALVLRSGTHVDLAQASALIAGGAACLAAAFVWAVTHHAQSAHWLSLVAAGLMAGGAALSAAALRISPSPFTRRCVEWTEYAALAAVVPLACWISGVFTAVRAL